MRARAGRVKMMDEVDVGGIVEAGPRSEQAALGKQFFRMFEPCLTQQHLLGFFIHAEIARSFSRFPDGQVWE